MPYLLRHSRQSLYVALRIVRAAAHSQSPFRLFHFDAAAIRRQPPHDPTVVYLQKGIRDPHRTGDNLRILHRPRAQDRP